MSKLISIFLAFIFISCGGGGSGGSNNEQQNITNTINTKADLGELRQTQMPTENVEPLYSCANPTKTPSAATNNLYFDVVGLQDELEASLLVAIDNLNTLAQQQITITNNGCIKAEQKINNASTATLHYWIKDIKPTNGQTCTIKSKELGKTDFTDVVIKIDCTTPVRIQTNLPKTHYLDLEEDFFVPKVEVFSGDKLLDFVALDYSVDDTNVATIRQETGYLIFKKQGKVTVTVRPDPRFYRSNSLDFVVQTKPKDIIVQALEIGQSPVFSIGASMEVVVPNKTTLVRVLLHSPKGAKLNKANLSIISDKGTTTKALTCPKALNKTPFANFYYALEETCYTILNTENELKNLQKTSVLKFDINNQSYYATPNVTDPIKIKLRLVSGTNSKRQTVMPKISDVKQTLLQAFPISDIEISAQIKKDLVLERDKDAQKSLDDALNKINNVRKQEDKDSYYYGFLAINAAGIVGLANTPGKAAVGIDIYEHKNAIKDTMAHEMGHNFGLMHTPCGTGEQRDSFWQSNAYDGVNVGLLTDNPIFVQQSRSLKSPYAKPDLSVYNKQADIMGYCNGTNFSTHNYAILAYNIPNWSKKPSELFSSKLPSAKKIQRIISGTILYPEDKIILSPTELTSNSLDETYFANNYGYTVTITTKTSKINYPLQLQKLDHSPKLGFELIVPFDDEIVALEFFRKNHPVSYKLKEFSSPATTRSVFAKTIEFKNKTISWNTEKNPFMTSVLIEPNGKRHLLTSTNTSGKFKIENDLQGRLEIYLSNGTNNELHIYDL